MGSSLKAQFGMLAAYNAWADERFYAAAALISDADYHHSMADGGPRARQGLRPGQASDHDSAGRPAGSARLRGGNLRCRHEQRPQ
jgi:hypothetical protein